ncbi:alpha/beta hydrolase [Mycolicibacterium duvalii]|uniref:alpha/beta fold hydrolase n=1 Tax=Mycolicibacterium duvalii TaxID=39688 RepID=UPI000BEF0642|nr:alpha/beta hydrolase [Mycolicibacterium duvalii]MCV7367100.1 alpha/beta hydrolase [Mycolicibacterium duvalii]PEG42862.1 alpha/beta hydrolase [Mycolicibacterium duvalii]
MSLRAPIHLGSGEPVLLLHPFMMSQNVWKGVAPRLADTGRYEVLAPTMPGHNGGVKGRFFLDTAELADDMERRMDELGWETAHIVGNSLGGWVAFELERRGRARSLTAIAPAGGWHRWSLPKYEIVFKFLMGAPVWITAKVFGPRAARLPGARVLASVPCSATPDGISDDDLRDIIDDVTHCAAYYQLLIKALLLPGLMELADTNIPTHMVICEKDRVLPHPRFVNHFRKHLPGTTRYTELDAVGHIPMFEAPELIAGLILDFLDDQADPNKAIG